MTSSSHESSSRSTTSPRTPLTRDELSQALEVEVYDRTGKTETLGTLIKGKRSVLIFVRHFCKSLSMKIPTAWQTRAIGTNPARVLELSSVRTVYKLLNTPFKITRKHSKCVVPSFPLILFLTMTAPVLIIGCGSFQPIDTYATSSSSRYTIYTDPTRRLHSILKFNSCLAEEKGGEEKRDYMRDAGSTMARIWGGIKGAMGHLEHTSYIGPKSLNGGEVVIGAGK
jgi:hypothetical protein